LIDLNERKKKQVERSKMGQVFETPHDTDQPAIGVRTIPELQKNILSGLHESNSTYSLCESLCESPNSSSLPDISTKQPINRQAFWQWYYFVC
jgi:hypothetical protein